MPVISPLAGKKAIPEKLLSQVEISKRYYGWKDFKAGISPFKSGTSGHRGEVGPKFCQVHSKACTIALVDLINKNGFFGPNIPQNMASGFAGKPHGPVIVGKDVRYVSDMIQTDVVRTFTEHGIPVVIHKGGRSTPTPVISFEILRRNSTGKKVEGVIVTASHNPPEEAGLKTNGFDGGPNTKTKVIDDIANGYVSDMMALMGEADRSDGAIGNASLVSEEDLVTPYVTSLKHVVRMDLIKASKMKFGVTPIGGSSCGYYEAINAHYGTDIRVFFGDPDPEGSCRTYDWDGKLRGDPSSKYVMSAVAGLRQRHGLAAILANDNDADRFGIEDSTGIVNPNHALCVIFDYLCRTRGFDAAKALGRSIGTTHMLDAIAREYGRRVHEKNVGFKYYVDGLLKGEYVLAGEESAGLSVPGLDGNVWVTEKDGIVANLLMMEIMAATGKDIGTLYGELVAKFGAYQYEKIDSPATDKLKSRLSFLSLNPGEVERLLRDKLIAGRKIERMAIGDGVKIVLEGGLWVLFRASGTEDIIKVYREEKGDSLETARKATEELQGALALS